MKLILALSFVCLVAAQRGGESNPREVEIDVDDVFENTLDVHRSINMAITDLVKPWYNCHIESTKTILGYSPTSYRPIYANKCAGACLSIITKPTTCQPTYSYVTVSTYPYFGLGFAKSVKQVTACNCKPKQCSVTSSSGTIKYYDHGATVIDGCNRKCTCSYGTLINCCRQRKEFRTMSSTERVRFIETYKYVSSTPPYKAQFDAHVLSHGSLFFSGIHGTPAFFPWHRYFILKLENLLQQVDCRVTVPYWDWALEAANPMGSVIWSDSPSRLGGDGNGGCVTDGPFASSEWTMANGQCLKRNFDLGSTAATKPMIAAYIANNPLASDYNSFREDIEGNVGTHDHVHCIIDGTMCTTNSALAPEFFLHHGFIDKIWHDWQMVDPTHVNAYSGSTVATMPGTATRPIDMFDLTAQVMEGTEAPVRVCYNEPSNFGVLVDVLVANIGVAALNDLPRVRMTPANPALFKMMGWNEDRIAIVRAREAAANDPAKHTIIEPAEARANCTLLASLGVFIPDSVLARATGELVEEGVQEDDSSTC